MAQVLFRDGPRDVPDHVVELLVGIETHRYTFEEAMALANNNVLSRYVSRSLDKMVTDHFRTRGN